MDKKYEKISQDLGVSLKQIDTVLALTAEGNTIPFIARYRKEATGNLDEVIIKGIIDLDKSLTALAERKEAVLAKIEELGKLTPELKKAIEEAEKLADVEELYLPYKEKRRTKATIAREAGLFPLARLILQNVPDLEKEAQAYVCEGFDSPAACLAGAVDILTEAISEDTKLRAFGCDHRAGGLQLSRPGVGPAVRGRLGGFGARGHRCRTGVYVLVCGTRRAVAGLRRAGAAFRSLARSLSRM